MSKANLAPDLACKPYSVHAEIDLMEWARGMVSRKVEADGEMALGCALAEVGFVRERTCRDVSVDSSTQFYCSECECTVDMPILWGAVNYCPNCGAKVSGD